jgi:hypothetical protein
MRILFRYKSDGTRALSYFVYLTGSVSIFLIFLVLHKKTISTGSGLSSARGAHVGHITQSASMVEPVNTEKNGNKRESDSFRLPEEVDNKPNQNVKAKDTPQSLIAVALHEPPPGSEQTGNSEGSGFTLLPPAFPTEIPKSMTALLKDDLSKTQIKDSLISYLDPALDVKEGQLGLVEAIKHSPSLGFMVPRGSMLEVCLLSTVDTSNPGAMIECALVKDLIFNHTKQINAGIRFLGKLVGSPLRGRLNLSFDTLITPSGLEVPLRASAVQREDDLFDYRPGIRAELISAPVWVEASPYIAQVITGFLGYFKSQVNTPIVVASNAISFQASALNELKASGAQASATAIDDLSLNKQKQWSEMYGPYYLVKGGTLCSLQLQADLDLAHLHGL